MIPKTPFALSTICPPKQTFAQHIICPTVLVSLRENRHYNNLAVKTLACKHSICTPFICLVDMPNLKFAYIASIQLEERSNIIYKLFDGIILHYKQSI